MAFQYNVLAAIIAFVVVESAVGMEIQSKTGNIIGNVNFLGDEPEKNLIWRFVAASIKGQRIKMNCIKVIQGDMSAVYIYEHDKESTDKVYINVYQPITVY